jgi:hypothetical protein
VTDQDAAASRYGRPLPGPGVQLARSPKAWLVEAIRAIEGEPA